MPQNKPWNFWLQAATESINALLSVAFGIMPMLAFICQINVIVAIVTTNMAPPNKMSAISNVDMDLACAVCTGNLYCCFEGFVRIFAN